MIWMLLAAQAAQLDPAAMTPEDKAAQLQSSAPADPKAGLPAYDWWSEGLHGLRARRLCDGLPTGDRHGGDVGCAARQAHRRRRRDRGAGQVQRTAGECRAADLRGADDLVAQHQHLPRSALGAGAGDLRRRPVSDRAARRRLRHRSARARSGASQGDRHAQAFRGPQRPRGRTRRLRRRSLAAGPRGDLSPRVPRGDHRGARRGR